MIRDWSELRVLLVEDSRADAHLVQLMLEEVDSAPGTLDHVWTLADARRSLREDRFDCILLVRAYPDSSLGGPVPKGPQIKTYTFPVSESLDVDVLRLAVGQLDSWIQEQRKVFVIGPEQDFFAVVVVCAWLMKTQGWDLPTSIWYVGSRRRSIWRYLDVLRPTGLDDLKV